MPSIGETVKSAVTSTAAGAAAAIKKLVAIPTIPPFMEMVGNFKSMVSAKALNAAIKKKTDKVKDLLNPANPLAQLRGEKTGIIASITPKQVKQFANGYKEGLKLQPKEALTGVIEKFTGLNLDQDNLLKSLGAAAMDSINKQIDAIRSTIARTVLGCIHKAIRDLLNKIPALDFLLNFESKINKILGKFRNQLERKIDAELRGLMYQKIKIHQLTLFKQRLHGSIRSICPEATPASSAEVQAFMNAFEEGKRKREEENKVEQTKEQIDEPENHKPAPIADVTTPKTASTTRLRNIRTKPEIVQKEVTENTGRFVKDFKDSAKEGQSVSSNTVQALVSSHRKHGGARLMQMSKEKWPRVEAKLWS